MDEILELQRQLQEVQETKTANQLSERVVVDLVQTIIKKYNQKLFFSQDGQEYIIPEHLDAQVNEIIQREGRINILELPGLLNIGLEKIEYRLDGIQQKYQDLIRLEDFIMTQDFLDGIAEEINEDLQQRAQILLSELTQKYSFSLQFIKKIIEDRIGTIIQGDILQGEKLTTLSFQEIMRAKIRGNLRASTKPVSVSSLVNEFKIQQNLVSQFIEDLIKNEELDGKVQGGMFIPNRFIKNQENIIKNFFRQNQYIEYSFLQNQLFIQRPKEILKSIFKDKCIFLENCCFNQEELKGLKENIEAILSEEGYTDLQMMLPSVLTDQDIESLLFKYMSLGDVQMVETYIFSESYLQKAARSFRDPIIQIIYNAPQKLIEEGSSSTGGAANKKKGKKGAAADVGKKKKGNTQKAGLFSEDEVMAHLEKQKIVNQDDRDEYFDQMLCKLVLPEISKFYDQIKVELFENKKSASSEIIIELQGQITDLLVSIQYVSRGFQYIEENVATVDLTIFTQKALFSQRMLLEKIVVFFCKKYAVQVPANLMRDGTQNQEESKTNSTNPPYIECGNLKAEKIFKDKAALVSAIEMMPKEYSQFLKTGMELYLKKQFFLLVEHLKSNQEVIGIRADLNKNTEKNYTYLIKYNIKEGLKKELKDFENSKSVFKKLLQLYLIDKLNLFFIGNTDDERFITQQILLLNEICQEEDVKDVVKNALTCQSDVKNKKFSEEEGLQRLHEINQEFIKFIKI